MLQWLGFRSPALSLHLGAIPPAPSRISGNQRRAVRQIRERFDVRVSCKRGVIDDGFGSGERVFEISHCHQSQGQAHSFETFGICPPFQPLPVALDGSLRLAVGDVTTTQLPIDAERHLRQRSTTKCFQGIIRVTSGIFETTRHPAIRRQRLQDCKPWVVNSRSGRNEFLGPRHSFEVLDHAAEKRGIGDDLGGGST